MMPSFPKPGVQLPASSENRLRHDAVASITPKTTDHPRVPRISNAGPPIPSRPPPVLKRNVPGGHIAYQ
eukprot:5524616-Karenia_brevis.AAC.1